MEGKILDEQAAANTVLEALQTIPDVELIAINYGQHRNLKERIGEVFRPTSSRDSLESRMPCVVWKGPSSFACLLTKTIAEQEFPLCFRWEIQSSLSYSKELNIHTTTWRLAPNDPKVPGSLCAGFYKAKDLAYDLYSLGRIIQKLAKQIKVDTKERVRKDFLELRVGTLLGGLSGPNEENVIEKVFHQLMSWASPYERTSKPSPSFYFDDEHCLNLIRLLSRTFQSACMVRPAIIGDLHGTQEAEVDFKDLWFPRWSELTEKGDAFGDLISTKNRTEVVDLNRDIVLPGNWKSYSLIDCLMDIGQGRPKGPFKQEGNHHVHLILPVRLVLVSNGNHSLTAGILTEGTVTADSVYDLTPIYPLVKCDGTHYRRTCDNKILGPVKNPALAAVFEIGRRLASVPAECGILHSHERF